MFNPADNDPEYPDIQLRYANLKGVKEARGAINATGHYRMVEVDKGHDKPFVGLTVAELYDNEAVLDSEADKLLSLFVASPLLLSACEDLLSRLRQTVQTPSGEVSLGESFGDYIGSEVDAIAEAVKKALTVIKP